MGWGGKEVHSTVLYEYFMQYVLNEVEGSFQPLARVLIFQHNGTMFNLRLKKTETLIFNFCIMRWTRGRKAYCIAITLVFAIQSLSNIKVQIVSAVRFKKKFKDISLQWTE